MALRKTLLITGATGKQGKALVDTLLASPDPSTFNILALTRKSSSPSAQALSKRASNIKIIEGDLNDCKAIFSNAAKITKDPVWGVFGMTTPMGGKEVQQGNNLVDASLEAGVKHFVFTSVDRHGEGPSQVPHFATKYEIENHLKAEAAKQGNKMSWTILRPVAFMDNFGANFFAKLFAAMWRDSTGGKALQYISCHDIGVAAAQAFLKPEQYKGRAISLASDEITLDQANGIFQEKLGMPLPTTYGILGKAAVWAMKDIRLMLEFIKDEGFGVDVQALRKEFPGLLTFAEWLEKESAYPKP